jgi:hypothetical protein
MTTFPVSDDLRRWSERAGYVFFGATDPGTVRLNDSGGEIVNYLRQNVDGWTVLTRSGRGAAEEFELATATDAMMERYLWGDLGDGVRSLMRLPNLAYPTKPEDIAPGYYVGEYDETLNLRTLFDPSGKPVARAAGRIGSALNLVLISNYLAAPLDLLIASFEDPAGKPLFELDGPSLHQQR